MVANDGLDESALRERIAAAGLSVAGNRVIINRAEAYREFVFELRQFHLPDDTTTPAIVAALAGEAGVMKLHWDALL